MHGERQRELLYLKEETLARQRALSSSTSAAALLLSSARADGEGEMKEREVFLRAQQAGLKGAAKELLGLQTEGLKALRERLTHQENRYVVIDVYLYLVVHDTYIGLCSSIIQW